MNKRLLLWTALGALALLITVIQFIPSAPVVFPAQLPVAERPAHRLVNFEGIDNFRDLGGYQTEDGQRVKWGVLYRSATFAEASRGDQQVLGAMGLDTLIDFRSEAEKEEEPNQLPHPAPFDIVEIPTLDGGDNSVGAEIMARIESGDFADFDPDAFMIYANRQFAKTFAPQYREFMQVLVNAAGEPVVWHCSAGKDRTGFAAAIVLRTLGVPMQDILQDYMLSKEYSLEAREKELTMLRLFKGDDAADKLTVLLGVEKRWLEAAFDEIDHSWGNFDNYLSQGLGLNKVDIQRLRDTLLEWP